MKLIHISKFFFILFVFLSACVQQSENSTGEPTTEYAIDSYGDIAPAPSAHNSIASVEINDQTIKSEIVIVSNVVAEVNGWLVIHADTDGQPGPIIGYVPVPAGESTTIQVKVDMSRATPTLFGMLHVDEGELGTFDFPGVDTPALSGKEVVMQEFDQIMIQPSILVQDQPITNGTILILVVYVDTPGWLVIYAEENGTPGPVIGYVSLDAGESRNIKVPVDVEKSTVRLFAMVHADESPVGVFEFPGNDAPLTSNETIVMSKFSIK